VRLSRQREPEAAELDRHQRLGSGRRHGDDLGIARIEPAGQRAERRQDQLVAGATKRAATRCAAHPDAQIGVEVARQLGAASRRVGSMPQHQPSPGLGDDLAATASIIPCCDAGNPGPAPRRGQTRRDVLGVR